MMNQPATPDEDHFYPGRLPSRQRADFEGLASLFAAARIQSGARHPFATAHYPESSSGAIAGFPFTTYAPPVLAFWELVESCRLGASPFDWQGWSEERWPGTEILDPLLIARLTPADLRRYLTMLQRAERFVDGVWGAALHSGVFESLLSRILSLDLEERLAMGR